MLAADRTERLKKRRDRVERRVRYCKARELGAISDLATQLHQLPST